MGDILSGGKIDESTSGPNPSTTDDRKRDILSEQKDKQTSDSVGGSQFPTRAQPPPQIPDAQQVVAPRIDTPTYFESSPQPAPVDTREMARQATIDVLKNVTINGQGPSIDGASISFNLPQPTKTSEITFSQPAPSQQVTTPQSSSAAPPQQSASVVEQGKPNGNTTSVTLEPPKRNEETSRLHSPDFGAPKDLAKGQPAQESRLHSPDFGSSDFNKGQPERESRFHSPDFGSSDFNKGQPERESRIHASDFGSSDFNKKSDSAKAYEEGERKREERKQQDPNFNRESRLRQEGETTKEFKERQEQLRNEKEMEKKAASGDLQAALSSGMVPVALTRADGNKKILAYLSSAFVGVTENSEGTERTTQLPDDASYYDAGGGEAIPHPWKVYQRTEDNETQFKIDLNSKVYSGTGSYDNIAVTGLNSWTEAVTGYVVLKGSVSNHEITSLSIVWGDSGSTQRAEFNSNNEQTDVTIRLGYIYQENNAWQIRQDVFGQLTVITTCYQTKPCLCFIQT